MRQVGIVQRRDLHAVLVDEFGVRHVEPAVLHGLLVEEGARIGGGQRRLDGVRVDALGEGDRLLDRLPGLAGQADDEGAVDGDAEVVAILGELLGHLDAHALLDVVQNLLVAGFVADEEQAQAVLLEYLQGLTRHVRLGVARPGHAELAELAGDFLRARQVVREGIVVEEELLGLRELLQAVLDLLDHVRDRAGAVGVPAHRLRPEAEGAARLAATARIERDVGVLEVPDEVLLHLEVALVHARDEGELVHVRHDLAIHIVDHDAVGVPVGQALDLRHRGAVGDFLDGEVELVAGAEIDARGLGHRAGRVHCHLRADQTGDQLGIRGLQRLDGLHVRLERRNGGVKHHEVEVVGLGHDLGKLDVVGRRVDELRVRHQGGGLRQPGRVPERLDLALGLVAGAGTAIEAVEGGSLQEKGAHGVQGLSEIREKVSRGRTKLRAAMHQHRDRASSRGSRCHLQRRDNHGPSMSPPPRRSSRRSS